MRNALLAAPVIHAYNNVRYIFCSHVSILHSADACRLLRNYSDPREKLITWKIDSKNSDDYNPAHPTQPNFRIATYGCLHFNLASLEMQVAILQHLRPPVTSSFVVWRSHQRSSQRQTDRQMERWMPSILTEYIRTHAETGCTLCRVGWCTQPWPFNPTYVLTFFAFTLATPNCRWRKTSIFSRWFVAKALLLLLYDGTQYTAVRS